MRQCKTCKHDMTDAAIGSPAHQVGICYHCLPTFNTSVGRNHKQIHHDMEAVDVGLMTMDAFRKRSPEHEQAALEALKVEGAEIEKCGSGAKI